MPQPGLSLVGFMAEAEQALWHLRQDCVAPPGEDDDATLLARWQAARQRLGPAMPGAGRPEVLPLPPAAAAHAAEVARQPWMAEALARLPAARLALVEIDRLACHQPTIATAHAASLRAGVPADDPAALLALCLPLQPPPMDYAATPLADEGGEGVLLRSPRGDFGILRAGVFAGGNGVVLAGVRLGVLSPCVHVVLVQGRGFLLNGCHRAHGARLAGATHIPCLVSEAPDLAAAGLLATGPDDARFPPALLASANPPTLGHFTGGRALPVLLRRRARVVELRWHARTEDEE